LAALSFLQHVAAGDFATDLPFSIHPAFMRRAIDFPHPHRITIRASREITMNKLIKTVILAAVAIAMIATSFEFATAGDRYWRHGHHGRYFHNRAVAAGVLGVTAGVVVGSILAEPRVVYRERPTRVIVDEGPVYADPDRVYAEPDVEYIGPVDEYAQPGDEDYVRPRDQRRIDQSRMDDRDQMDEQDRMGDQAQDDNYFPDRPQKRSQRNDNVAQGNLQPWTAQWRSYCKQRFSSFNATTGTYTGYDGKSHFCTAG
jgi:hypothetical protein